MRAKDYFALLELRRRLVMNGSDTATRVIDIIDKSINIKKIS